MSKHGPLVYCLALLAVAAMGLSAIPDSGEAAWRYVQNPSYKFYYKDNASKKIAIIFKKKGKFGLLPFRLSGDILRMTGTMRPSGKALEE
ncbi:hypothetical protein ACFL2Q_16395 [Thermodesulfobacteriota bacterium]